MPSPHRDRPRSCPARHRAVLVSVALATGCSGDSRSERAPDASLESRDAGALADASAGPDSDNDGVADAEDNCPGLANSGQFDEDGDSVGDGCDNCPAVANGDQADVGEDEFDVEADGVGDACDPNPSLGGDRLALFLGFNEANEIAAWTALGANDFSVVDGQLRQRDNSGRAMLFANDLGVGEGVLEAKVTLRNLETGAGGTPRRGVAVVGAFSSGAGQHSGLGCGELQDLAVQAAPFDNAVVLDGTDVSDQASGNTVMSEAETETIRTQPSEGTNTVACSVVGRASWTRSSDVGVVGTGIALVTWGTGVDVDYLVAFSR